MDEDRKLERETLILNKSNVRICCTAEAALLHNLDVVVDAFMEVYPEKIESLINYFNTKVFKSTLTKLNELAYHTQMCEEALFLTKNKSKSKHKKEAKECLYSKIKDSTHRQLPLSFYE